MSRANINFYNMEELSSLMWNATASKFCCICKRCSSTFDTQPGLQRHKLECFINSVCQSLPVRDQGQGQSQSNAKSGTGCILSPKSAVFAASAVPPEYCEPQLAVIQKSDRTQDLNSNLNQDNIEIRSSPYSLRSRSGRGRSTHKLNWSKWSTPSDPDKRNQNASSQMGIAPTPNIVLKQTITTICKKIEPQGPLPSKVSFPQVAATMYNLQDKLKGYKIPKKNSILPGVHARKSNKPPEVDDGIVPDLVPPSPRTTVVNLPNPPNETKKEDETMRLETSDYASNSSSTDCDSSGGGDFDSDGGGSRKSSSTPQPQPQLLSDDHDPCSTPSIPSHFEINEEECDIHGQLVLQEKMEAIQDLDYYVIVKCDDELEFVDVFTEEDADGGLDWSMEQGKVILLQQLEEDYEDPDPVEKCVEETTEPNSDPQSHSVLVMNNENHSNHENSTQEMLDLELGAVETVIESEESFGSEEGDASDDLNSPLQHFTTTKAQLGQGSASAKTNSEDSIQQDLEEKSKRNLRNLKAKSKKKLQNTPNSLLTSVLEKTLLIKLRRCDGAVTSMPKLPRQHWIEEIDEIEYEEPVVPVEVTNQEPADISTSLPEDRELPEEFPIEMPIPEVINNSPPETPQILTPAPIIEKLNVKQPQPLKRKHSKGKREAEEKWDIINHADLNEPPSKKCPIKLKIKRRRLEDNVDFSSSTKPEKVRGGTMSYRNTSSPQFFNGTCKICGGDCSYTDAKTYYTTSNDSKPFCCCTCFDIFSEEEWSAHNKVCHNVEEFSFFNENPNADLHFSAIADTVMQRDFICSNCFNSMSKLLG